MTFGEKIQALRKSGGMSQEQLAARLGVSRQAISKWELGESSPEVENILQLGKLFDVTTDYLLKEEERQPHPQPAAPAKSSRQLTGRIFYIVSAAFMAIGLFCAFGGWHEHQTAQDIWGSMIIQVVGIVAYYVGRILCQTPAPLAVNFVNLALLSFMPVSMAASLPVGYPMSPYPYSPAQLVFFVPGYFAVLGAGYYLLRKKSKRPA